MHYNIMIFNTIEKQLRNFNTSRDKLQNKCPINFNQLPSHYSKPREFLLTQCKRDFQNRNLHSPTSNTYKDKQMLMRTLSGQKLKKNQRLNKNSQPKHKKSNSINQNLQDMKQRKQYANLGLQNHIDRLDFKQDNKIYDYSSPQSSHIKKENKQLSQTGISTGSQLYELSPIHFNKYLEYMDRNSKREAVSFGEDRYNYFAGQQKIREVPNYSRVSGQKTFNIMDRHQQRQINIQKDQLINQDNKRMKIKYDYSTQTQKQNIGQCISGRKEQSCEKIKTNQNQLTFSKNQHKINEFQQKISLMKEDEKFSLYNSSNLWIFVSVFSVLTILMFQIFR